METFQSIDFIFEGYAKRQQKNPYKVFFRVYQRSYGVKSSEDFISACRLFLKKCICPNRKHFKKGKSYSFLHKHCKNLKINFCYSFN